MRGMSDTNETEEWRLEEVAEGDAEIRRRHEENRKAWNEGAAKYTEEIEASRKFLTAGKSNVHPIELANLKTYGPLSSWCDTAIHLQCAGGRDTLSLFIEGARSVIGIDISDRMIENARELSRLTGIPAEWHRCDVLDAPSVLDGTADLVYTGRGALCWIQDIRAWARVVARLLKPGGVLSLFDGHPFQGLVKDGVGELQFAPGSRYFRHAGSDKGWPQEYIGRIDGLDPSKETRKYERIWTISEVIQAVIDSGLRIDRFGEHVEDYWVAFPVLKEEERARIPATFSLCATKSGGAARRDTRGAARQDTCGFVCRDTRGPACSDTTRALPHSAADQSRASE